MKLLTRKETSDILGITPGTLDVWRKDQSKNFPPIRAYSKKVKGWLIGDVEDWQRDQLGVEDV